MPIVNGYATLEQAKDALGIDSVDSGDNPRLEMSITASSRHLEQVAGRGRRWWADTVAVARSFWPSEPDRVWINDLSSTTDLVVTVDDAGDGSFATTLTLNTHFILEPINAAADGECFTSIRRIDGAYWPCSSYGRPTVRVTGLWGWPAVPAQVTEACILQAKAIFKSPDTTFGVFQAGLDGFSRTVPAVDPMARAQIAGFVRYTPCDDEAPGV